MRKSADKAAAGRRCAIYTRKSSEEGLDQAYNSLHAQRDACEAYIKSQAGERWGLIKTAYDDGGFSGGNMDRPALKQLLADVAAGAVDIIVVYKVDRLTRSLMDFAKIVEVLDGHDVSFVSVTQAFNTTTSMGRLTLNVLLSFAQFEREVTGERIRDKIAASKAKGIWMGGVVPLGYDARDRTLIVNDDEAKVVRHIFERYLKLASVPALVEELEREGVLTKGWTNKRGEPIGGMRFSVGAVSHLLRNQLYLGRIVHRAEIYPGLHQPIVSQELFDQVQAQFAANRHTRKQRPTRAARSPLTGIIFDADGGPMSPSFCYSRRKQIYRYYISAAMAPGRSQKPSSAKAIRRVPAAELEELIREKIQTISGENSLDWPGIRAIVARIQIEAEGVVVVMTSAANPSHLRAKLEALRERLPKDHEVTAEASADGQLVSIFVPIRPVFRGGRVWLNEEAQKAARPKQVNAVLVDALKRSHRLLETLQASPLGDLSDSVGAAAPDHFHARRLAALGFLAPDIQGAIIAGRQPPGLVVDHLYEKDIPLAWADQREAFGFPAVR